MNTPRIRTIVGLVVTVVLLLVFAKWAVWELGLDDPQPFPEYGEDLSIISTRGHLRAGEVNIGHNPYDYSIHGIIPGMTPGTDAPDDLLVIIHGFNNDVMNASDTFGLARDSLTSAGYEGALVGYSWDANTQVDPIAMTGFHEGRLHTIGNGPKLARFVVDYKARWPNTRIHIMGYSMGCRLAVEVLWAFDQDPALRSTPFLVDSVHLVGASIDDEEIQTDQRYGTAIENRAGILITYFSREDNILGTLYMLKEGSRALGLAGIENPDKAPRNYVAIDVESELIMYDDEGNVDLDQLGDNHMGCLGNRDDEGNLLDDGVLDIVVETIRGLGEGR